MKTTNWIKGVVGIAAAALVGCSGSSTSQFPAGQFATGLRVVYSNPDYLQDHVSPEAPVYVGMSEPVDPSSISGITMKQTNGSAVTDITATGHIDLVENNTVIVFSHTLSFHPTAGFTLYLPGTVRAASGKQMVPTNVTFFTGDRIAGVGSVSVAGAPYVTGVETSSFYYGCMEFVVHFDEDLSTAPQASVDLVELFGYGRRRTLPLNVELLYGNSLQTWLMSVPQGYCPCDMFMADVDTTIKVSAGSVMDLQGERMAAEYKHTYGWGNDFSPQICYY